MNERETNHGKIVYLRKCLEGGYLLHGGKIRTDLLVPMQAKDDDTARKTGQAFAIYAEATDIRIPILISLFAEKDTSKRSWRSEYTSHFPGPIKVGGENYTFTPGYVYVLPRESFTTEGNKYDYEYISRVPVVPKEVIAIDPSILSVLEGIEFQ